MGVVTISSLSFCFGRAGGIFGQRPALQNRRRALYRRRRPRHDFHFVSSIAFGAGGHGHRSGYGFADVDGDTRCQL